MRTMLGRRQTLYFCIPPNDKLLGYWDALGIRLFKIRTLHEYRGDRPPAAPVRAADRSALLVRATAMGLDVKSVLNEINSPLPCYRFNMLVQKAVELCGELNCGRAAPHHAGKEGRRGACRAPRRARGRTARRLA